MTFKVGQKVQLQGDALKFVMSRWGIVDRCEIQSGPYYKDFDVKIFIKGYPVAKYQIFNISDIRNIGHINLPDMERKNA